jgi:hypothetical protein
MSLLNHPENTLATGSGPAHSSVPTRLDSKSESYPQSTSEIDANAPEPRPELTESMGSDNVDSVFTIVQSVLTTYLTSSPLYKLLLSSIILSSASHGHVTLKLVVLPLHVNSKAGELVSPNFLE